jgi:hypothetical protein
MEPANPPLVRRRELAEILEHLERPDSQGALLVGEWGSGKTVLLRMLAEELTGQGRAAFLVGLRDLTRPGELAIRVLDMIAASPFGGPDGGKTLRSSAGVPRLSEAIRIMQCVGSRMPAPVLLLDGLDESPDPRLMASVVETISLARGWQIVVSSRPAPVAEFGRFSRFATFQLGPLTHEEATRLLHQYAREIPDREISERETSDLMVAISGGVPLALRILAASGRTIGILAGQDARWAQLMAGDHSVRGLVERLVDEAIANSPDPAKVLELLERIALAGGRERIAALAAQSQMSEQEVQRLMSVPETGVLIVSDHAGGTTLALLHDLVRDIILMRRFIAHPFRLRDLRFGNEEAERDELLDDSFVPRQSAESILDQKQSIVVGDRGAGKSAIFHKLATATGQRVDAHPVTNTSDLLHRVVDKDGWLDTDALKAAWLVVVAAVTASTVPPTAPRQMRRNAAELRVALGLSTPPVSRIRRALQTVARLFGGTKLGLAVGPVSLEAQLPSSGRRPWRAAVDVESFLRELDGLLRESGRRVVVLFDQIDETFKYNRGRQEAVVQALLQAESRVSLFESIGLVVFLRTDLFELYDIQEKNKLVSRRLTLDWSEEDWLQVLVRRVLANEPLQWLADRLRLPDGTVETNAALRVLFPPEIEERPADRWLIDSLRNGNGDVSPRLAVVLLHLARKNSAATEQEVDNLPLFSVEAVTRAMTELSELSFSEVVDDFKVAPSFVWNCRAGKLDTFALPDVEKLFDKADGEVSDQVRKLERLGFLERVVRETDEGAQSLFQIPDLYTRCWDHA